MKASKESSTNTTPPSGFLSMRVLLGDALLAELLRVSNRSLRRYGSGQRASPGDVLARLQWLAEVVNDLSGAYNRDGIRRWFKRQRAQLAGRNPRDFLGAKWLPRDARAQRVRELASMLSGVGASGS